MRARYSLIVACGAAVFAIAGCGVSDGALSLQDALEKSSGSSAKTLSVRSLYPGAERVLFACPYSGFAVNEALGTDTFKGYEDTDEGRNWVVLKQRNGAVVKVAIDRTQIDLCSGTGDGMREVDLGESVSFEQVDGTWFLVERDGG